MDQGALSIKLFLPRADPKGLRIAEIPFQWTGTALAAPRTEIDELLKRRECDRAGVYVLTGVDPETDRPHAYIGEAEVIRERLKQHKGREFWTSAIVFVSKDESLNKAHVRWLESRLIRKAADVGRFTLEQNQPGDPPLSESECADMEVFLSRILQILPLLGCDLVTPIADPPGRSNDTSELFCRVKGAEARGRRTPDGFVVFRNSTAVLEDRPSAQRRHPFAVTWRQKLIAEGVLVEKDGFLLFSKDAEFPSPSTAASVVHGGGANGLKEWRTKEGTTLRELDEGA